LGFFINYKRLFERLALQAFQKVSWVLSKVQSAVSRLILMALFVFLVTLPKTPVLELDKF
jgi:hypothetical protein